MSPPWPVSPLTPLCLCIPSSPPRPVCPRTPLGSLVPPDKPRSVVAQHLPWTSGSPAVPRPSTPSAPSGFPIVLSRSIVAPVSQIPGSTSVTRANSSTLGFQAFDVARVRRPLCSTSSSTHPGSASVDRLLGVAQAFGQSYSLVPPTDGSTMVLVSDFSRFLSVTSTTPSTLASALFPLLWSTIVAWGHAFREGEQVSRLCSVSVMSVISSH